MPSAARNGSDVIVDRVRLGVAVRGGLVAAVPYTTLFRSTGGIGGAGFDRVAAVRQVVLIVDGNRPVAAGVGGGVVGADGGVAGVDDGDRDRAAGADISGGADDGAAGTHGGLTGTDDIVDRDRRGDADGGGLVEADRLAVLRRVTFCIGVAGFDRFALFPYTTLFRSGNRPVAAGVGGGVVGADGGVAGVDDGDRDRAAGAD